AGPQRAPWPHRRPGQGSVDALHRWHRDLAVRARRASATVSPGLESSLSVGPGDGGERALGACTGAAEAPGALRLRRLHEAHRVVLGEERGVLVANLHEAGGLDLARHFLLPGAHVVEDPRP